MESFDFGYLAIHFALNVAACIAGALYGLLCWWLQKLALRQEGRLLRELAEWLIIFLEIGILTLLWRYRGSDESLPVMFTFGAVYGVLHLRSHTGRHDVWKA